MTTHELDHHRVPVYVRLFPVVVAAADGPVWLATSADLRVMNSLTAHVMQKPNFYITVYESLYAGGSCKILCQIARHVMEWLDDNTPDWAWSIDVGWNAVLSLHFPSELERVAYTLRFA